MANGGTDNRRIGRYELLDEIGRGGMAVVYRALDTALKREVALKLLHPHLADHAEARKRFEREAHAVARLHHSSLVEVYDYSDASADEVYIVMELVEGPTLRAFLRDRVGERPLLAEAAALIARKVAEALAVAHEQGVVHRDVKPENILIGAGGALKLSDFGIAHLTGFDQMTVTGQILGSPAYMSPEHIEMAELDARADIFSLGTLLYEMAVGSLPFQGKNPHHIIKRIIEGYYDHPLSVNPAVGHRIASIIVRCLQPSREQRYPSASAVVAELDAVLSEMGIDAGDAELAAFLSSPEEWESRMRGPLAEETLALGTAARRAGRYPEAMDHYNRVLALEPGNERALYAVAGLSRRRRLRRFFERMALALAVVVGATAIAWPITAYLLDDTGAQVRPIKKAHGKRAAKHVGAGSTGGNPGTEQTASRHGADAGTTTGIIKGLHPILKRLPAKPKEIREVVFNPQPMRVEIEIDRGERFVFKTTDRSRRLTVGTHVVSFIPEDPRLETLNKEVVVAAGVGPFAVGARLKWRPARLKISSNVDAVVEVVGRSPGRTNTFFAVPIENGPEERVKVAVSANGYLPRARQVTIAAGDETEIPIELQPAPRTSVP
jgi:eukaryotic-like serine/threonine-protein kinase